MITQDGSFSRRRRKRVLIFYGVKRLKKKQKLLQSMKLEYVKSSDRNGDGGGKLRIYEKETCVGEGCLSIDGAHGAPTERERIVSLSME